MSNDIRTGRICEIRKNTFLIRFEAETLRGRLAGGFFNEHRDLPVVGDHVDFRYNPCGDSIITEVHARKSELRRPDIFHMRINPEQVMCANFDYVFIATSLNDNYNPNRIARYIAMTLQGNGIPVVLLTKADLCDDTPRRVREIEALSDKVRVHALSVPNGVGLDALKVYLEPGKTIAILGSSGVGKSTLVNALTGSEVMRTSGIREDDSKGRHTTTHRQMLELPGGAMIIDTPGMRELGMCDVDEGIDETFGDIDALAAQCRFGNCSHTNEPGCAVRRAIREGALTEERLSLFMRLHEESDKAAKMKKIALQRRKLNGKR